MLNLKNHTPFEAGLSMKMDKTGAELACFAVKATFDIPLGDEVKLSDEQLDLCYIETPFDTNENSGIKYPCDIAPDKPNTDIGFAGSAWSKKPVKKMDVTLQVGQYKKKLKVFGDRYWKRRLFILGYRKTSPELFLKIPMTSDRIFGGTDRGHKDESKHKAYEENQHGTGFFKYRKSINGTRLPNFEHPKHLISSWRSKPPIGTFGFSPATSKKRRKYGGTFNQKWQDNQFPLPPIDFDPRFYNCAQKELTAKGFLYGGEKVELKNLSEKGDLSFSLPKIGLLFKFFLEDEIREIKPNLINLVIEPDHNRFYMTWGTYINLGIQPSQLYSASVRLDEPTKNLLNYREDPENKQEVLNA